MSEWIPMGEKIADEIDEILQKYDVGVDIDKNGQMILQEEYSPKCQLVLNLENAVVGYIWDPYPQEGEDLSND